MERNTMMSHIDGLVNNLDKDIDELMRTRNLESARKQKEKSEHVVMTPGKKDEIRTKENQLMEDFSQL